MQKRTLLMTVSIGELIDTVHGYLLKGDDTSCNLYNIVASMLTLQDGPPSELVKYYTSKIYNDDDSIDVVKYYAMQIKSLLTRYYEFDEAVGYDHHTTIDISKRIIRIRGISLCQPP